MSVPEATDERFDEAEADVDYGSPWLFREPGAPNPLTILVTGWSTGVTKLGEAEFLLGTDRNGKRWSVLVGCLVLTKRLIDGTVEEWDDERNEFVVVETLGRAKAGEVVSMRFLGDAEGARFAYPNFKVSRKPAPEGFGPPPSPLELQAEAAHDADVALGEHKQDDPSRRQREPVPCDELPEEF